MISMDYMLHNPQPFVKSIYKKNVYGIWCGSYAIILIKEDIRGCGHLCQVFQSR